MPHFSFLWQRLSARQVTFLTLVVSFLLSLSQLTPGRPIDPDTITFINAAHTYWQSGWQASLRIYPWPFFPIACIHVAKLCHIPLVAAFHTLNAFAQALLCLSFVWLIKQLGGPLRTQKIAAVVILLDPFLNSIRSYGTRDSGYWAFALLAVFFMARFLAKKHRRDAIAFAISMLIAFLFRIEALLMLITAPLAIFWLNVSWPKRCVLFVQANSVFILLSGVALVYHFGVSATFSHTSRLHDFTLQFQQFLPHLAQQIQTDAHRMGAVILTSDARPTEVWLLTGGLISLCLSIIVAVMKPLLAALAVYGQSQRLIHNQHGQAALLYLLITVNALMLVLFTLERYFLATRYPAFLCFLWLCWVPFALVTLYDHHWQKKLSLTGRPWFFPSLVVLLVAFAIGGIVRFGYSKAYITQAGDWLAQHTPPTAKLYTNSKEIAFYAANRNEDLVRLNHEDLQEIHGALQHPCEYDWLALRINRNDDDLKQDPVVAAFLQQHQAKQVFSNKRHDAVYVYDMKPYCPNHG